MALRTQQVIAYESDVTKTVDPFAGSYVVESMTDDLEAATPQLMQAVEDRGGAVAAIEEGYQKSEIERSAYRIAQQIDDGERVVVGLNRFTVSDDEPYEPLRVDPAIEAEQAARLATLRAERDQAAVDRALAALQDGGRRRPTTCSTPCARRCGRGPRSARSVTRCVRSGAPTCRGTPSDRSWCIRAE